VVERDKSRECKKCKTERGKIYRLNNSKKNSERYIKWSKENQENIKKYNTKWVKKNRDSVNQRNVKYRRDNPYSICVIKKAISNLNTYINFKLSFLDIPSEMVEIKRLQMQLHHAIKAKQSEQT
jgi:hypothetical protein